MFSRNRRSVLLNGRLTLRHVMRGFVMRTYSTLRQNRLYLQGYFVLDFQFTRC